MKRLLLTLMLFAIAMPAWAQYNHDFLQIHNPQRNWDARHGTIEEAAISVRPKGVYAEVGVYLTFSDQGTGFATNEDLEVQFFFSLPPDAIVTDSWLWVGEDIVRASLIDRWTASEIYEGIVNRNRDPSLLIKQDQEHYELRVYPMAGGTTRKVKLTYLVPMRWTEARVHVPLPIHWLETSAVPVETFYMLAWPDETWKNPYITEDPQIPVQHLVDEDLGEFDRFDIHISDIHGLESMSYDAPLQDGVFISRTGDGADGYYQLAYLPSSFSDMLSDEKKVAILFDYDATKTDLSAAEILDNAQQAMKAGLSPADSFNVLFSQIDTRRASDLWLPARPEVIDSVFTVLTADVLASYSNLPSLLADGISFLEEQGGGGNLVVISSSDALFDSDVANQLIGDLRGLRDPLPTMLFADIANTGLNSVTVNTRFYEGNGYLYTNLARMSGGQFMTVRSGKSYQAILGELLFGVMGSVQAFDLYATLDGGFTYGRFSSISGFDAVPLNTGVTQVGKFIGDFPFVVEASGIYESTPFSNRLSFTDEDVLPADTTLTSYWTGKQIDVLERAQQDDMTIAEIIDYSLRARVISLYTAFLALEPGLMGQEPCGAECEDETEVTPIAIEEETPEHADITLEVYPNPFTSRATIKITLPEPIDLSEASFQVYNAMGQVVRTLQPASLAGHVIEVVWDGTTDAGAPASSGIYFFVMTSPQGRHSVKLVLVR